MTDIVLTLNPDQALVLFDILAGFSNGSREGLDLNEAEGRVFDYLETSLEAVLVEPFEENYKELVRQAYARLISE